MRLIIVDCDFYSNPVIYMIVNVKLLRVLVKDLLLTYLKMEKFVKDILLRREISFGKMVRLLLLYFMMKIMPLEVIVLF